MNRMNENTTEIMKKWGKIEEAVETTCTALLKQNRVKKKEWMTEEILIMIEEGRKYKNKNIPKYREIHRIIRTKIKETKEIYDKYNGLTTGLLHANGSFILEQTQILKI